MTEPLVVLIFLVAKGQSESATSSMTAAARQALGADTVLLFEERITVPPPDEAIYLAGRVRAGAVVELAWVDSQATRAVLHAHTVQRSGWAEREIDFAPSDAPSEYGRTLGFAIASMITNLARPSDDVSGAPGAPGQSLAAPEPPPAPATLPVTPSVESTHAPGPEQRARFPTGSGVAAGAQFARYRVVEATALASTGAGAGSNGLGAALSAGYSILPSLAAQLDAGVRFGDIATAQATFSSVHLGGGATWRAFSASGPRPFELDLRVDFFATELLVSRAGESRSTWLPEAGLALEAAWFPLAPNIGAVLAAGVEAAFGTTQVAVANDTVATMPPFRAVGSFGLRVRF